MEVTIFQIFHYLVEIVVVLIAMAGTYILGAYILKFVYGKNLIKNLSSDSKFMGLILWVILKGFQFLLSLTIIFFLLVFIGHFIQVFFEHTNSY